MNESPRSSLKQGPPTPKSCTPLAAGASADAAAARREAERLLAIGEPLSAYDLATSALLHLAGDVRLRQLRGIALSRSGAVEAASEVFQQLAMEGHQDEETLGNLARTYKARWLATRRDRGGEPLRRKAFEAYCDAYRRTSGYWSGVNAATLALAGRDDARAAAIAKDVLADCQRRLAANAHNDETYWLHATCGEACLVQRQLDAAAGWYAKASKLAGRRYANIASTRAQAKLVCEFVDAPWERLRGCFPLPRVVAVSGHMIDATTRAVPRFSEDMVAAVRQEIDRRLTAWGAVIGFSSAACGADLIFLEAMAERGHDVAIVLPFPVDEFTKSSIDFAGSEWRRRFETVLSQFSEPIIASNWPTPHTDVAFDYSNRIICGLAKLQADLFEVEPLLLAVWDGESSGKLGGTASVVMRWRRQGLPVEEINLPKVAATARGRSSKRESTSLRAPPSIERTISAPPQRLAAVLFADVQGFSLLSDDQIPAFVRQFMGRVSRMLRRSEKWVRTTNTWGDGFFATFHSARAAGRFALDLARMAAQTPWPRYGLPASLSVRVALHAGPVYAMRDPVTHRRSFWGGHVSRGARIEPITPPGVVYASQAFAAFARDEGDCDFGCLYVGRTPLAKGYGTFPTYHVTSNSGRQ